MKITKEKLKRIIREEISKVIKEFNNPDEVIDDLSGGVCISAQGIEGLIEAFGDDHRVEELGEDWIADTMYDTIPAGPLKSVIAQLVAAVTDNGGSEELSEVATVFFADAEAQIKKDADTGDDRYKCD